MRTCGNSQRFWRSERSFVMFHCGTWLFGCSIFAQPSALKHLVNISTISFHCMVWRCLKREFAHEEGLLMSRSKKSHGVANEEIWRGRDVCSGWPEQQWIRPVCGLQPRLHAASSRQQPEQRRPDVFCRLREPLLENGATPGAGAASVLRPERHHRRRSPPSTTVAEPDSALHYGAPDEEGLPSHTCIIWGLERELLLTRCP